MNAIILITTAYVLLALIIINNVRKNSKQNKIKQTTEMKTTKGLIGLFLLLAVANLFLAEWLISCYAVICFIFSILLLHEEKKNVQLTSKLTDAEIQVFLQRDEIKKLTSELDTKKTFEESQRAKQFELLVEISDLKTQLETAKSNSYIEVERKRGREKYNRLYKGKKKNGVAAEQKSEPNKIEPFRMVVNPKQSAIVQQILFDNGYDWLLSGNKISNLHGGAISLEKHLEFYGSYPDKRSVFFTDTHLPKISFSKFMSMYGKKQQPYTIDGKTIKEIVEENLGIEVIIGLSTYYLCGYDVRGFKNSLPFIIGKNEDGYSIDNDNAVILSDYTSTIWESKEPVINAIKKHRNIK